MVDEEFKNAVNSEDIKTVRDKLCTELHFDHNVTSGTFRECMDYCKQQGLEKSLYEVHDGRELKNENSIDYYQTLVGQLCTNFSKERLEHAVSIAKNIWKDKQLPLSTQEDLYESEINISCKAAEYKLNEQEKTVDSFDRKSGENQSTNKEDSKNRKDYDSFVLTAVVGLGIVIGTGIVLVKNLINGSDKNNSEIKKQRNSSTSKNTFSKC